MSVFDVQDCCCEINSHLSLVQLLTIQRFHLWYTKPISIRNIVIKRFIEVGYDPDFVIYVLNAMSKSKSVISGSFMIAVLVTPLDEPLLWIPDNIRLYTHWDETEARSAYAYVLKSTCGYSRSPKPTSNSILFSRPPIKKTIFESSIDIKKRLISAHHDDLFKITYDGANLLIKELHSVLECSSSWNWIDISRRENMTSLLIIREYGSLNKSY
jgi:hypothetical protein